MWHICYLSLVLFCSVYDGRVISCRAKALATWQEFGSKRWIANGRMQVCVCGIHRAQSCRQCHRSQREYISWQKSEGRAAVLPTLIVNGIRLSNDRRSYPSVPIFRDLREDEAAVVDVLQHLEDIEEEEEAGCHIRRDLPTLLCRTAMVHLRLPTAHHEVAGKSTTS